MKIPLLSVERIINTSLAPAEVIRRLEKQVEKPSGFGWPSGERLFEGMVEGANFRIWRALRFQITPFVPIVTGTIYSTDSGTRIIISLRPVPGLLIMLLLMFIFPAVPVVSAIFNGHLLSALVYDGCLLLMYAVIFPFIYLGFEEEVDRAVQLLKQLWAPGP